jgi:3-oxoacyl-[acyl-carrier-protein] synthase II
MQILGLGPVCAVGNGVAALREGLLGRRQPQIIQMPVRLRNGERTLPVYQPNLDELERFIPRRNLRRIDRFARMALLSAHLAVEDSGLQFTNHKRVGIVIGSAYGATRTTFRFLDGMIDDGDQAGASPTHFANSVHNALAAQISMMLKINGPCTTITTFNHTTAGVWLTAQNWLNTGLVDYVLAGIGDEYCDVLGYSAVMKSPDPVSAIAPMNFETCSFLPGEGMICFLLAKSPEGASKLKKPQIQNMNIRVSSGDARRLLHPSAPVFITAHGRADEGRAFRELGLPQAGTLAHAQLFGGMPSAGAFETAIAALSLQDGIVYGAPSATGAVASMIHCIEYCAPDEFNLCSLSI